MKTINLLSAFYLCSLLIFSANGMELKLENQNHLDLTQSIRVIVVPTKVNQKGWYEGFTDLFSNYKDDNDKALRGYLNKNTIPKENRIAARNTTSWALDNELTSIMTNIKIVNSIHNNELNFPISDLFELNKKTSIINSLLSRAKYHRLQLPKSTTTKAFDTVDTAQNISLTLSALIVNNSFQIARLTNNIKKIITPSTTANNKITPSKAQFMKSLSNEMLNLYKKQQESEKAKKSND